MIEQAFSRNRCLPMGALATLLALLLQSAATTGYAQPARPDGSAGSEKPAEPESAPRGQRVASGIKYGDWRKVCFKTPGTNMVCRTSISGTFETGQSAVRIDLIERDGGGAARLQLFLPVGLYLQAGVKLTLDQGTTYRIPYVWCLTNTCIAADVADPKLIAEMESGQKLLLEVVDSSVLTVTTSLPLDHFREVRQQAPAQIFEQSVDE
jgi:invasion protein IalB